MSRHRDDDPAPAAATSASGRVRFDDRGNAVWETWRGRRLEHPALKLAEEPAPPPERVENRIGALTGYDPYQSGMLSKEKRRRTDLRKLSQWIELQKRMQERPKK